MNIQEQEIKIELKYKLIFGKENREQRIRNGKDKIGIKKRIFKDRKIEGK